MSPSAPPKRDPGLDMAVQRLEDRLNRLPRDRVWALVDVFRETVSEQIEVIRTALRSGDGPGMVAAAHALRGSAVQFGTERMVALCAALEETGRSGVLREAEAVIPEVMKEFERLEERLETLRLESG